MTPVSSPAESAVAPRAEAAAATLAAARVTLLTGGIDPPYVYGIAMEIIAQGFSLDVIGSTELDRPEMHTTLGLNFINLHGSHRKPSRLSRGLNVLAFYFKLIRYVAGIQHKLLHILWNNKLVYFDRTLLMLLYKLLGKRVVFTAHNVNAAKRDGNDSWLNRRTLSIQYRLLDHIFVHTEKMKHELLSEFGIGEDKVTVIPFGINNSVPDTELTSAQARQHLGIAPGDKAILFFGRIRPYKGLMYIVDAFQRLVAKDNSCRLIIAGEPKKDVKQYWAEVQERIAHGPGGDRILQRLEFIPDAETEVYYKAADVSVLPYTDVFQSGILFLSYSFGLPVIATDVGALGEDIVPGETGFLCRPRDAADLAQTLEQYFASDLYGHLATQRAQIKKFAQARHSWSVVGTLTHGVYDRLLGTDAATC